MSITLTQDALDRRVRQDTLFGVSMGGTIGMLFGGPPGFYLGTAIGAGLGRLGNVIWQNNTALTELQNGTTALNQGMNDLARSHFKNAGVLGVGYAYQQIGRLDEIAGNIPSAAKAYQKALEQALFPCGSTQNDLARLLSAPGLSADAANQVGIMYQNGDGIQQNYLKAHEWYERAIRIDDFNAPANRNMGISYEWGFSGAPRDSVNAARYYRKAVNNGLLEAKNDLARIYHNLMLPNHERELIEREALIEGMFMLERGYFTERDALGCTPLERALKGTEEQRLYTFAAQLLNLGSPDMFDLGAWAIEDPEHLAACHKLEKLMASVPQIRQIFPFVETSCSKEELIPHVVLVTALQENNWGYYKDADYSRIDEPGYKTLCCIKGIITPEGLIGHHLNLDKLEYKETMPDRPHLHWSWNQLVQPNSGGSSAWEKAQVAIFEPLSTFEDSIINKPFGIAPYDTFTFGSHHLSERATLLIPVNHATEVESYLESFKGRIVTYNPDEQNLRSAVFEKLNECYPDIWPVCNGNGMLMGDKIVPHLIAGYTPQTYLKKEDGEVLRLINREGRFKQDRSKTMREYSDESKRFIGLHDHSVTAKLEDNPYFKESLRKFTANSITAKNNPLFAGKIEGCSVANLGSLKAYEFYLDLLRYNSKTGVASIANHVINAALHSDLVSLFYQMNPEADKCDLSPLELNMIFSSEAQVSFITLLADIKDELKTSQNQRKAPNQAFERYCIMLKECLANMQQAKEKTSVLLGEQELEVDQTDEEVKPLCLVVGQEAWEKTVLPEAMTFDLAKHWPLDEHLYAYVYKILRTLPADFKELRALYTCLSALSQKENKDQKERYRLNVICNVIQWAIQEKFYLGSRDEKNSILANKLSKVAGWLKAYHLEAENFTKKLGDCLFDNVINQLPNSKKTTSQKLRETVVDFMRENCDQYNTAPNYKEPILRQGEKEGYITFNNWDEYLTCMKKPEVWATELEIEALTAMLGCPIVLINIESKPKIYNPNAENSPIFLHPVEGTYFESCLPAKGLEASEVYPTIKKMSLAT